MDTLLGVVHYSVVGAATKWRVQAFWRVGTDLRSYAPVFAATEAEARDVAADMAQTLWHFVDLDVRLAEIDATDADAEQLAYELKRSSAFAPLLHVFNHDRSATLCGASIDVANAALTVDVLALSDGPKCSACVELLRSS